MDHLVRTPLLEHARASKQRLKPGGAVKARTRRHRSRTAAAQPHAGGESNIGRRVHDRQRMNDPRSTLKGMYQRKAQSDYKKRPSKAHHGHLAKKRKNPHSKTRPEKRGNPQAKMKTQVRTSPSKLERRPTLPRTLQFFQRGSLTKGFGL